MSLDEGDSRRSYDQEGDGLNITNFPTEPRAESSPYIHSIMANGNEVNGMGHLMSNFL